MAAIEMRLPELERPIEDYDASKINIFSGRSNPSLAKEIAQYLGNPLSQLEVKNFSDGETYVRINESVRGHDVFVVQSTCSPVNDNLMELLLIIDALKRSSANSITAVIPYYGYARQDRKTVGREAISAKLVADMLTTAGAHRVLAMDLHTGQLQGFFNVLTDHLYVTPVILNYLLAKGLKDVVVVSPDAGGVERARVYAKKLNAPIAIIDKRRSEHNKAKVYHIIGEVKDKTAIIIDDMIDTAGTICAGAQLLEEEGAKAVYAAVAHPVFSGPAVERLGKSVFTEVITTNTIPLRPEAEACEKITQLSVAAILGEAIRRIHGDESVSQMFE